jgi:hypothetical protein
LKSRCTTFGFRLASAGAFEGKPTRPPRPENWQNWPLGALLHATRTARLTGHDGAFGVTRMIELGR